MFTLESEIVAQNLGDKKAVDWVAKKITEEEAKLAKQLDRCVKNQLKCVIPTISLAENTFL